VATPCLPLPKPSTDTPQTNRHNAWWRWKYRVAPLGPYHFALGPMITRSYQERVKQPKKYPRTFGANSIGLGYWFKPNGKG
jgi:hypothetical protein